MGCYDGAEICELVGIYLLDSLNKLCGNGKLGLYRDDGLGVLHNTSGPKTERMRKNITKLF